MSKSDIQAISELPVAPLSKRVYYKYKTIHMNMSSTCRFIFMLIKHFSTKMVLQEDSL